MKKHLSLLAMFLVVLSVCIGCIHLKSNVSSDAVYTTSPKKMNVIKHKITLAIKRLTPQINEVWADQLSGKIFDVSKKYDLDWRVMVAVMKQESNFDPKARNNRGIGLGQIEPLWSRYYGYRHQDLWNWEFNVEIMGKILAYYRDERSHDGQYWVSAYHSLTPRYRQRYWYKVRRHYQEVLAVEQAVNHIFLAQTSNGGYKL